jgi:hypothetical protein
MRLGLDYHGIIDKHPKIYGLLSKLVMFFGGRVFIITGHSVTPDFIGDLHDLKMRYDQILSIIDYHKDHGIKVRYDEKGDPWIDEEVWNATKADLCELYNIDVHVDDSKIYGKYFKGKTKYLLIKI